MNNEQLDQEAGKFAADYQLQRYPHVISPCSEIAIRQEFETCFRAGYTKGVENWAITEDIIEALIKEGFKAARLRHGGPSSGKLMYATDRDYLEYRRQINAVLTNLGKMS